MELTETSKINLRKSINYKLIASSNGTITVTRGRKCKKELNVYKEEKQTYVIPYYFNSFKFREDMRIKAGVIKQCFDFIGLKITGKGYKSIHEFKHCYV